MHVNNFDANLLRTLDVLLAEKNVTRAAARLCISQPAMSGSLQRLREYFDDQLLIRMGREMVLTPLAESLVGPVRETLLQIQLTLSTRPTFDPKATQRDFNLTMSDYGSFVLMPTLLRRFAADAPSISCSVEPFHSDSLARVETGEVDLVVAVESCELLERRNASRDLKMRRLYADEFVCLVDRNHGKISGTLTKAQYIKLPHALVRFGYDLRTIVEQAWHRESLKLNVAATAPSFSSMLLLLPGTELIATAPRRLAETLAPSLGLKILECPLQIQPLQQIIMWHPRNDPDPAHQYLRQAILDSASLASSNPHAEAPLSSLRTQEQRRPELAQI